MRIILCNASSSLLAPSPSFNPTHKPTILHTTATAKNCNCWQNKALTALLTGALSLNLLIASPSSLAIESPSLKSTSLTSTSDASLTEPCHEDDEVEALAQSESQVVTNERIVEEAWQIVNDSFLDTGRHRWTPENWQQKREDILASSIQTRSKAHDLIKRMLASLGDPYTRFLSPAEGDELLAVNGVDVKGKSAFEVSSLLQGPNETFVTIEVKHGNCGPIQSLEVQRQLVARTPVLYRLEQIDNGSTSVGYIRLKEFNALARKDLVTAMKRLQDMGASFFVLDLRDNLGGLVQITYTVGRDPQYQKTIVADSSPLVTTPVIVLVNNKTASASEIVASALHDNCRAVLVGERTFGKGLIQSVFELHDGSGVVVTIGMYVTPNHMDINGNGIEPDYQSFPAWNDVAEHLSQCNMPARVKNR